MTTVVITSKFDVERTMTCLRSLVAANQHPSRVVLVSDDDAEIAVAVGEYVDSKDYLGPELTLLYTPGVHRGHWGSVNTALKHVDMDEPFVNISNDMEFDPDWLLHAETCFRQFDRGLGVLALRDDIQNGFIAPHPMTTRNFLRVVNGEPFFPSAYWHYYADSELSERAKDLNRYVYCEASYVPHKHTDPNGGMRYFKLDAMESDYEVHERRIKEWYHGGGLSAAKAALL